MGRLLFLSCSKRKRPSAKPLPAVKRYDGPTFRVLRRYLNKQRTNGLSTYVLSAKHGVIPGSEPIPDYDQQLTSERAQELKPQVETQLRAALRSNRYTSVLICGSRKGRGLIDEEWEALESCRCPACIEHGLEGLKAKKIFSFSNRAAHNLWVLLEEARHIDEHLQAGTYEG